MGIGINPIQSESICVPTKNINFALDKEKKIIKILNIENK